MFFQKIKKEVAIVLTIMLVTSLIPMRVLAKENTKDTAVNIGLNKTDNYVQYNGIDDENFYLVETERWYKFKPQKTDFYEINLTDKNKSEHPLSLSIKNGNDDTLISLDNCLNGTINIIQKLNCNSTYYIVCGNLWFDEEYENDGINVPTYSCSLSFSIKKHVHKYTVTSNVKNNNIYNKYYCSKCKNSFSETVYAPKMVLLSNKSFVFNNKAKKPQITIKDIKNNVINSKYYTVKYPSNPKKVGTYNIKIIYKDKYSYYKSKTVTYRIIPKNPKISKIKPIKNGAIVFWNKQSKEPVSGYVIQYSNRKDMKNAKKIVIKNKNTKNKKVKKLKKNKKYYFRVANYKTVKGKKYFSKWSGIKQIKI